MYDNINDTIHHKILKFYTQLFQHSMHMDIGN